MEDKVENEDKLFVIIDSDDGVLGYVKEEKLAKDFCDIEDRKYSPYSYGYNCTYHEVNLLTEEELKKKTEETYKMMERRRNIK